jgi:HPt (histidine-containing phosphotransfer) domain-containing protein
MPESVRHALEGLRELGGDDLPLQMIAVFIEHSDGRMRALLDAINAGDAHGAAEAAHALKGSSRQLGLNDLADACGAVEQAGKAGDAATAKTLTAAVQQSYTTAVAWLRSFRA